jgi:hypothetical protein
MKNSELDSVLRKARIPQPSNEFLAELPEQMARELNRSRMPTARSPRVGFPRLAWGLATIFCALIAFTLGHWRGRTEKDAESTKDILTNMKFVQETLATFPGQVRAIVEDQWGLDLILSDTNNIPPSAPLYVRVRNGNEWAAAVTFSGQEIQIAGQKLTVLSDAHGGIILVGNDFAWSSRGPAVENNDLKISAKDLGLDAL